MNLMAVGFWGAYFGSVTLAFVAALLAFTRSARRVALTGSVAALLSATYALVFLGWVPVQDPDTLLRLQAHVAIASTAVLGLLFFMLLGTFRNPVAMMRCRAAMLALTAAVLGIGWLLPPDDALNMAVVMEAIVATAGLAVSVGAASRGERAGWLALAALPCMLVALAGLYWYALHPDLTPWQLHAASALASMAYLLCIATAMWTRYSYLIEVSEAMKHGPNFDPITRMPSHEETGIIVSEALAEGEGPLCGVIAVSIANLKVLEQLHGRAAYNHALFVCASRLRRMALSGVMLGRLPEDGFLLLVRNPRDAQQLIDYAEQVMQRLSRPVVLGTSRNVTELEASGAVWQADIGVGLLMALPHEQPELAIAGARAISRTALSYPSRIAWYDEAAEEISELPVAELRSFRRRVLG